MVCHQNFYCNVMIVAELQIKTSFNFWLLLTLIRLDGTIFDVAVSVVI